MKYFLFFILFCQIILADNKNTLPVELLYFNAAREDSVVLLSWGTATESNNYGFIIERSINLIEDSVWDEIGFVEGAGQSNIPVDYVFTDTLPEYNFINYYRLKQVDVGGHFEYSDTVQVDLLTAIKNDIISSINFYLYQNYPNPFNSQTIIKFSIPTTLPGKESGRGEIVTLKVYDILGREVTVILNEEKSPGDYEIIYNDAGLTSGIYFYTLTFNSFSATKKLILLK